MFADGADPVEPLGTDALTASSPVQGRRPGAYAITRAWCVLLTGLRSRMVGQPLGGPPLVSPPQLMDCWKEPEDGAVREQLVTRLLPVLANKPQEEFNVFDVMRYGGHERQLSDVFAWLLDAGGTHKLGDA